MQPAVDSSRQIGDDTIKGGVHQPQHELAKFLVAASHQQDIERHFWDPMIEEHNAAAIHNREATMIAPTLPLVTPLEQLHLTAIHSLGDAAPIQEQDSVLEEAMFQPQHISLTTNTTTTEQSNNKVQQLLHSEERPMQDYHAHAPTEDNAALTAATQESFYASITKTIRKPLLKTPSKGSARVSEEADIVATKLRRSDRIAKIREATGRKNSEEMA